MKLLDYKQFTEINESLNDLSEFSSATDSQVNEFFNEYERIEEGLLKQIIGWSFFAPFSLLNVAIQFFRKKVKIQKMLKNEPNPAKREALKDELKNLKYEEVKAKEKVTAAEEKVKLQAIEAKEKMTPEEKEQYAAEVEKNKQKLEKAKEAFEKEKEKVQGFV